MQQSIQKNILNEKCFGREHRRPQGGRGKEGRLPFLDFRSALLS